MDSTSCKEYSDMFIWLDLLVLGIRLQIIFTLREVSIVFIIYHR